jgi:hypothetical protein
MLFLRFLMSSCINWLSAFFHGLPPKSGTDRKPLKPDSRIDRDVRRMLILMVLQPSLYSQV